MWQMINLLSFIWPSVVKYKLRFLIMTILICSWSLESSVVPFVLGRVVDGFTSCKNVSAAWSVVGSKMLLYFGLWFFIHSFCRIGGFIRASLFPDFAANMRMRAFEEVSKKSYSYFVEHLSGDLAAKIYMLQEKVVRLCASLTYAILPAVGSLIFAAYLFCSVKIEIAITLFFWLFLHMATCIVLGKRCTRYEEIHSTSDNLLSGRIVDTIANYFTWKVFCNEVYEREHVGHYQRDEISTAKRSQGYLAKLHTVLSVLSLIFSCCGISLLGYHYWQSGAISVGEFVFIMNAVLGIEAIAWNIGLELPNIFSDIGACKQAFYVISEKSYVKDAVGAKGLNVTRGEIVFDDISFAYGEKEVFEGLSVNIRSREKIGIVGKSGAGKTTFINLLLRLYDLKSGRILIDDQDISEVTQKSLRNSFSFVPQDPTLFHRSILENLKYGNLEVTDEEIKAAIRDAHMEDVFEGKDWNFDVGEGGSKLSKGQRQRVAVARAFLRNAPILILDEATSALDAVSEKAIQESLDKIMNDKTVIVIAHRLSTLQKMDRILVFDQGKIVETGSHSELLQMDGLYKKLWQIQKGGFVAYDEK